jgi:transcriptional regulator with XRE-family HTH domain
MTSFGKVCKKLRLKRNMSLNRYANILGFTSSYVSNHESGRDRISKNYVDSIIKYLCLDKEEVNLLIEAWIISKDTVLLDVSGLSIEERKKYVDKVILV